MLSFLIKSLLVHMFPNFIMKLVKSTKFGHDILASTLLLGLEGKELSSMAKDILGYVVGPETLVEYSMGKSIRAKLEAKGLDLEIVYASMFQAINSKEHEVEGLNVAPILSSFVVLSNGTPKSYDLVKKVLTEGNKGRSFKNIFVYVAIVFIALILDPVALMQPVICQVRKSVGQSELGKSVLKDNLKKGIEGQEISRTSQIFNDFIIAPSVLDTQRIGLVVNNNKDLHNLELFIQEVKLSA